MTKIDQIAQAFAQGVKFAENLKLAMDAAKGNQDDEEGHWVTIGAEAGPDGEKHGGRPVFIKGAKKKGAKTESKKAESKKSETKTKTKKSETPRAGLLTEQGSSLAQLAEREYDKVITAIKDDVSSIESDPTFPPEVKRYETVPIKSNLRNIKAKLSDVNKDLSTVKDEVSKAVKDGNFNRQGVESVWRAMKQLKDRAAYVVSHTNSETAWLGRNNTRGMTETAETLNRLSNEASGIRHDANRLKEEVLGSIAQYEQEGRAKAKKAESKPAQQRTESWREMEARHRQEVAARANRSQEDIEAAHQIFLKFDRSAMRTMMEVSGVTFPAQQRMRDIIRGEIPGADGSAEKSIKDSLRQIRSNIDAFDKTMGKIQSRIARAASDGKIGEGRADAELRDYRRYYKTFADYIVRASKQMNNLDHTTNDGHREDREVLSKIANLTSEMVKDATEWNNKQ